MMRINFVHRRKIRHIGKKNSCFHNIFKAKTRSGKHRLNVFKNLRRLTGNIFRRKFARRRIDAQLSRKKIRNRPPQPPVNKVRLPPARSLLKWIVSY